MEKRLFITGNSSGLGRGLTQTYLARDWSVYGLSRRGYTDTAGKIHDVRCDLADQQAIPDALARLLQGVPRLELVILNAGILGRIADMDQTPLAEIRQVMEINVWANKTILDWLKGSGIAIGQIVLISSGAAVNGSRGWGAYSLSKASLNMLTKLYAREFTQTHLSSLAPGLVDTPMQDHLCAEVDVDQFPSVKKLLNARGTAAMPDPHEAGDRIADVIPALLEYPSGDFVDICTLGVE